MKPTSTQQLPATPVPDPSDWRITLWEDQATSDRSMELDFPVRTGGRCEIDVSLDLVDDPDAVRKYLRKKDAHIPMSRPAASTFIQGVLQGLPTTKPNLKVSVAGWHGKAFVVADRVLGKAPQPLKLSDVARLHCRVEGMNGELLAWKSRVAQHGVHSSYLTFGILVALAAPMMAFAGLSEGAFFNLSGPGSSGKTTVTRAALSIFCSPNGLLDWNATLKSFEELAAAHNDMLIVFDDTEKADQATLLGSLDKVTHAIVSGKPKSYSANYAGADPLRKVTWRTFGLSSSPIPLEQYYLDARKKSRTGGQQRRMFDIPVENTNRTGVFDLVDKGTKEAQTFVGKILKDLESGMAENHGVALEPWIEFLTADKMRGRITTLVDEFADAVRVDGSGPEGRLTSKFGLAYAAGALAIEAGILPWTVDHVRRCVRLCCERARRQEQAKGNPLRSAFQLLESKLGSKATFPNLPADRTFLSKTYKAMLGFRRFQNGKTIIAIQQDKLADILKSELDARELLADFHRAGIGKVGQGGKKSVQYEISIRYKLGDGRYKTKKRKPRFHVFRLQALRKHLSGKTGRKSQEN